MNLSTNSSSADVRGDGCLMLLESEVKRMDSSRSDVSTNTLRLVEQYGGLLISLVCLIGLISNILNMLVFFKLGFQSKINISLFALSFADLMVTLVNLGLTLDVFISLLNSTVKKLHVKGFLFRSGASVLMAFMPISSCLSAFIAVDRCLAVTFPLRLQNQNDRKITTVFVLLLHGFLIGGQSITFGSITVTCVYNPVANTTEEILMVNFKGAMASLTTFIIGVLYGLVIPGTCLLSTFVATLVTVIKLKGARVWRVSATSQSFNLTVSTQELIVIRTLVATSVLFMVCMFPLMVLRSFTLISPDVKPGMRRQNLYFFMTEIMRGFICCNSSFNFIAYFKLGSKFRATLVSLCRCSFRSPNVHDRSDHRRPVFAVQNPAYGCDT